MSILTQALGLERLNKTDVVRVQLDPDSCQFVLAATDSKGSARVLDAWTQAFAAGQVGKEQLVRSPANLSWNANFSQVGSYL